MLEPCSLCDIYEDKSGMYSAEVGPGVINTRYQYIRKAAVFPGVSGSHIHGYLANQIGRTRLTEGLLKYRANLER